MNIQKKWKTAQPINKKTDRMISNHSASFFLLTINYKLIKVVPRSFLQSWPMLHLSAYCLPKVPDLSIDEPACYH